MLWTAPQPKIEADTVAVFTAIAPLAPLVTMAPFAAAVSAATLAMLRASRVSVRKDLALLSSAAQTLAATTAPAVVTIVSFAAAATVRFSPAVAKAVIALISTPVPLWTVATRRHAAFALAPIFTLAPPLAVVVLAVAIAVPFSRTLRAVAITHSCGGGT